MCFQKGVCDVMFSVFCNNLMPFSKCGSRHTDFWKFWNGSMEIFLFASLIRQFWEQKRSSFNVTELAGNSVSEH